MEKIHNLKQLYYNFLMEGISFLTNLFEELKQKIINEVQSRIFIYIGDLERYIQLNNEEKNWTKSKLDYERAIMLDQTNGIYNIKQGNAYNQLAVLSLYKGNDFDALYYYIRSLSSKKPFPSSKNNINTLFEKFKLKKSKKSFIVNFIELIDILFTDNEIINIKSLLNNIILNFKDNIQYINEEVLFKIFLIIIFIIEEKNDNFESFLWDFLSKLFSIISKSIFDNNLKYLNGI
jgi:hypothetical protein